MSTPKQSIMKRILFIFSLLVFLNIPASRVFSEGGFNLQKDVSIDVRDMNLAEVLEYLAQKGGYEAVISENLNGAVTIYAKNIPIKRLLDAFILTHHMYYEIKANKIVFHYISDNEKMYKQMKKKLLNNLKNTLVSAAARERISADIFSEEIIDILKFYCLKGKLNFIIASPADITGKTCVFLEDIEIFDAIKDLASREGLPLYYDQDFVIIAREDNHIMKEGEYKFYYPSGQLYQSAYYVGGRRQGAEKFFFKNGQIAREGLYEKDILVREVRYNRDGHIVYEESFQKGNEERVVKEFDADGNIRQKNIFDGDVLTQKTIYANGNIEQENIYGGGVLTQKTIYDESGQIVFSGNTNKYRMHALTADPAKGETVRRIPGDDDYVIKEIPEREILMADGERRKWHLYWPDGQLKEDGNFRNGHPHGSFKYYTKSGMLYREKNYLDGKEHGILKEYWDNGQLKSEVHYSHGKKQGISKFYLRSGQLRAEEHFVDGKKQGIFKFYKDDGFRQEVRYKADQPIEVKVYDEQGQVVSIRPVRDGEFSPALGFLPTPSEIDLQEVEARVSLAITKAKMRGCFDFNNRREITHKRETMILCNDEISLSTALELYRIDTGYYPTTQQGLMVLKEKPASESDSANWKGPYIIKVPADPWGNPYIYTSPGTRNKGSFDLTSYGPDGIESKDDIKLEEFRAIVFP